MGKLLDYLKLKWTLARDLFNQDVTFYVYLDDEEAITIKVQQPGLLREALTWGTPDVTFSGSFDELSAYLETLTPANNVTPIR